jgi:hypothetical protein
MRIHLTPGATSVEAPLAGMVSNGNSRGVKVKARWLKRTEEKLMAARKHAL